MCRHLEVQAFDSMLEVGAGELNILDHVAKHFGDQKQYLGIELLLNRLCHGVDFFCPVCHGRLKDMDCYLLCRGCQRLYFRYEGIQVLDPAYSTSPAYCASRRVDLMPRLGLRSIVARDLCHTRP